MLLRTPDAPRRARKQDHGGLVDAGHREIGAAQRIAQLALAQQRDGGIEDPAAEKVHPDQHLLAGHRVIGVEDRVFGRAAPLVGSAIF